MRRWQRAAVVMSGLGFEAVAARRCGAPHAWLLLAAGCTCSTATLGLSAPPRLSCISACVERASGCLRAPCSQQVVDFVHQRLAKGVEPRDIASELLNACLANDPREARGIGCDNMTAAVRCGSGICSRKLCADAAAQG